MTRPLSAFLKRLIWLCMAPLLLLSGWLAWTHLKEIEARHQREAANLARNFAVSIDSYLESRLNALNVLAVSPLVDDPRRWPDLYAEAQGFRESFGAHVAFADQDRQMLFNTRKPYGTALPPLSDAKWRSAAPLVRDLDKPRVGDIAIGPLTGRPRVTLVMPVLRTGKPVRFMLGLLEPTRFQERMDRLALPAGWAITLRDGAGVDIARRWPPGFERSPEMNRRHQIVARLEQSPWSVVLEMPRSSQWAGLPRAALVLGVAIGIAALLGIAGGSWAGRRIGRQVEALARPLATDPNPTEIAEFNAAHRQMAEAQMARETSEARFRQLFELAPLPLGYVAPDGRILALNQRFEKIFGYTRADLRDIEDWWRLAHPDEAYRARARAGWEAAVARATLSGDDIEPDVYRITCKDGRVRDMQVAGIVLGDGMLATFFDVTRQKDAEQALEAMLEGHRAGRLAALNLMEDARAAQQATEVALKELSKLSMAVEQSPESIIISDLDGRIEYVNAAFIRNTGYSREEMLGQTHRTLHSASTSAEDYAALWTALEAGDSWKGEFRNRRKDGTEYIDFAIVTPLRAPDGRITHYVAVQEDNLKQYIQWEPRTGGCYLFSGLRGAGKTTELNRLVTELREDGIAAYYCDASTYLNLNDPQLSLAELLMTALAGLADAVRQELGQGKLNDSIWQRTKRLFQSKVELKPKLIAPLGDTGASLEVEATLQDNPDFRKELISFAQSSSAFFDEAAKFADEVAATIRRHTQCEKIVLVVDSLERISAPSGDEAKLFNSLKEVFFNEPTRLQFASLFVVYSAPPYLHAVLPGVSNGFSQSVALPNFKVIQRDGSRNEDGICRMREIVDRRFPKWREILDETVMNHLAWMSGGNVRRFFNLLRTLARKAALSRVGLPITAVDAPSVIHALAEAAQPLQWLTGPDREWLKRFMDNGDNPSGHIKDLAADLPPIIRLFDHSLVLDYQNGSPWYQVPPLVRPYV